jgi:hypothetical protein
VADERGELIELIASLVAAMEASSEVGCTDHLDCWDEAEEVWHAPLRRAKELLECR